MTEEELLKRIEQIEDRLKKLEKPALRLDTPWNQQACEDWIERFNGTAPGGRIGKALKPLVAKHSWEAVRPAWKRYLESSEPEFVSPEKFASTYGSWTGNGSGNGKHVIDKNRATIAAWLRKEQ